MQEILKIEDVLMVNLLKQIAKELNEDLFISKLSAKYDRKIDDFITSCYDSEVLTDNQHEVR